MLLFAPRWNVTHLIWLPLVGVVIWFFSLVMVDFSGDAALPAAPEAITWPMLPGENLNQLATLFYPGNKPMQRRFVTKTLELSHGLNSELDPEAVFDQPVTLLIPKTIWHQATPFKADQHADNSESSESSPDLRMSYQIQGVSKVIITPAMQAEYENLNQRNLTLKQDLQHLDSRLVNLQSYLNQLNSIAQASLAQAQDAASKFGPGKTPINWSLPGKLAGILMLLAIATVSLVLISSKRKSSKLENAAVEAGRQLIELNSIELVRASAEDIRSLIAEAKICVYRHKTEDAVALLSTYIEAKPKAGLPPWLYLLDIYRSLGKKDEFLDLARRFNQAFNVMTPQWEEVDMKAATHLEEFPHIMRKLIAAWSAGKAGEYLKGLLDNRDGARLGFSLGVLQEIVLLQGLLEIRDPLPD